MGRTRYLQVMGGESGMNREFADHSWAAPVTFEDRVFDGYDFSGSNLDNVLFVRCDFRGSRFGGGISGGVGFFGCNFTDCVFDRFDFRRVSVGADGGDFLRCQFIRCNFAGRHFERPHFDSCVFDRCRLRNIIFNDSTFRRTTFIGKLEDVTFNGMYRRHDGPA